MLIPRVCVFSYSWISLPGIFVSHQWISSSHPVTRLLVILEECQRISGNTKHTHQPQQHTDPWSGWSRCRYFEGPFFCWGVCLKLE